MHIKVNLVTKQKNSTVFFSTVEFKQLKCFIEKKNINENQVK